MEFLKQHKLFNVIALLFIIVFSTLFYLSYSSSKEVKDSLAKLSQLNKKIDSINEETALYSSLDLDYKSALEDLENLAKVEKQQHIYWRTLLNEKENHYSNWKQQSSESVNAEITKLFTSLKNQCEVANLNLPSSLNAFETDFSVDTGGEVKSYGFGLSSYDGFWPSIDSNESKSLSIQGKIIKEIIGLLCNSTNELHSLFLLEIKREAVGPTDNKHIGSDKINLEGKNNFLLRSNVALDSFVFELKFRSHTSHARLFINQLRPPFLVRNLRVERLLGDTQFSSFQESENSPTFGESTEDKNNAKKLLPIVTDVKSDFTILIEYLKTTRKGIFALYENKFFWEDIDAEIFEKFLIDSGNEGLIRKTKEFLLK